MSAPIAGALCLAAVSAFHAHIITYAEELRTFQTNMIATAHIHIQNTRQRKASVSTRLKLPAI